MKKLIFKKFYIDISAFFLSSLFIMGLIVWTLQAVNYFDFVTEDGHGLEIYFYYTILNFPKVVHRILPFMFFISLFYIIVNYELRNELNIFWLNGISKINFLKKVIYFSIFITIIQIFLGSFLSPISQLKGREFLKNSNIDFFTSLIKEGKFINIAKDLTIFIKEKNSDGSYSDIFLDDSRNINSKMIHAKKGILIEDKKNKIFRLTDGRVINNEDNNINIFDFDEIDFNLKNFSSNTITVPKIQEIDTISLINCFTDIEFQKFQNFKCERNLEKNIKQELLKRIYKPIYIPLIALICCFLITNSKNMINYKKKNNLIFLFTLFILILSEASLRYSASSNFLTLVYLLIPIFVFITSYIIFHKRVKNV